MKDKEDLYKNRVFSVASEIGEGRISFPATVEESYGTLCLVLVRKAYERGPFSEYGIFNIGLFGKENEEALISAPVNFELKDGAPARRAGSEKEVREIYERMVSKMIIADSEAELSKDHQIRDTEAKGKAQKLKADNNYFVKNKVTEVTLELKELLKSQSVEKIISDKKFKEKVSELLLLEKFQTILKLR